MPTQQKAKTEKKETDKLPTREQAMQLLKSADADESVIAHCKVVSALAVKIAKRCKKPVDIRLVEIGGLLHDLGRSSSHGIDHAVEGARIAREKNLPENLARIIERHIGAGLSKSDAEKLGLPVKSYIPRTIEEKIVAHADNLIGSMKKVPVADTIQKLVRKGELDGARRVVSLHKELSEICGVDLDLL